MMHISRIAIENFRNFSEFDVTLSGNVVRLKPVTDDGPRYLNATFEGGDMALLEWLAIGSICVGSGGRIRELPTSPRRLDHARGRGRLNQYLGSKRELKPSGPLTYKEPEPMLELLVVIARN